MCTLMFMPHMCAMQMILSVAKSCPMPPQATKEGRMGHGIAVKPGLHLPELRSQLQVGMAAAACRKSL